MTARGISCMLALAAVLVTLPAAAAETAANDDKALDAQARQIAQTHLPRFGEGYVARIDPTRRLVYISALDDKHLAETAQLLAALSDAWCKTLGAAPPAWYVAVILPTAEDYKKLAPREDVTGFYDPAARTLTAVDRGRVLMHEFTHALHHAEAAAAGQNHPIWITEGFATLLEACEATPAGLRPSADLRLLTLQKALREQTAPPLTKLLTSTRDDWQAAPAVYYAEARYLMLYLHEQGKLPAWYARYKETYRGDPTGKEALAAVLGKPISQIEEDWRKYVQQLQLPWGETRSRQGRLGLEFQDTNQGVKVVALTPGGAAERAGRIRVDDIITKFNGQPIANIAHLVAAIRSAGAHRTVKVELLRHGRAETIDQPLGAPAAQGD